MATVLELQNIQKKFKDRTILESVNLNLQDGEFLSLLGPSGCGKSTLLRLMAGLENPTSGTLSWHTAEKKTAFVFQEAQLLSWRTVLENVRLPLEIQAKLSQKEQDEKSHFALQKVNLTSFESFFPHELSGGMKMRVSIARALSASPKILFMDEPFSALDEITRFGMQKQLRTLCEQDKLSVVFVTHSSYEAAFLADRVLLMSAQGGQFLLNEKIIYSQPREDSLRLSPDYHSHIAKISAKMSESFL
ncbi:MAG TPA: ABC transporter ATP-binding protein [Pseudobdellovibrionaceae bacterium]|jgi:NitT/TauT family transport system ATP-binding protein